MSGDERHWMEEATAACKRATECGLTIAMVRLQDDSDEADIYLTNATTPETIQAMAEIIRRGVPRRDES